MDIRRSKVRGYDVLSVDAALHIGSDASQIFQMVSTAVKTGTRYVALRFAPDSYFSSDTISVLIRCHEVLIAAGGELAVIAPGLELMQVLVALHLDKAIAVYGSPEALPHRDGRSA
jgi:hypothetical protein